MKIRLGPALKSKGMKQARLAEIVDLSPGYVSSIVSGKKKPSTDVLEQIANALEISVGDLYEAPRTDHIADPAGFAESEAVYIPKTSTQTQEKGTKALEYWEVARNVMGLGLVRGDTLRIDIRDQSRSNGLALINRTDMFADTSATLIRRVEGDLLLPHEPDQSIERLGGSDITFAVLGWIKSVERRL